MRTKTTDEEIRELGQIPKDAEHPYAYMAYIYAKINSFHKILKKPLSHNKNLFNVLYPAWEVYYIKKPKKASVNSTLNMLHVCLVYYLKIATLRSL